VKALTFRVRFFTAQFKIHTQKLTRRSYLIPPPSAVTGFFGAVLGLPREVLYYKSDNILAGAELLRFEGRAVSLSRIFKIDRSAESLSRLLSDYYKLLELSEKKRKEVIKDIQGLLTIKEDEMLYMPEYKFAVASTDDMLIERGFKKLKNLDFEYDVFGGNDYHFVEYIGDVKLAKVIKTTSGRGYCRCSDLDHIEANEFTIIKNVTSAIAYRPLVIPAPFHENGTYEDYVQVYGADIVTRRALDAVDDGESKIFVYKVRPFIAVRI